MLEKLLRLVATGGIHSHAVLAEKLDVTEPLLDQMIESLVRLGYLRPVDDTCPSRCEGCPMHETCGIGSGGRLWVLTERGERAAEAQG
ncbi:MAG: hypothetical protein KKA73_19800 [Chloroflexi bacterium]|nr:hypothetical protein [Chloroflexota bacterium]